MNKRITSTLALATALITIAGGTALAMEGAPKDPNSEVHILAAPGVPLEQQVTGILEYRDLEGGYYAVGDWALMGDLEVFKANLGKQVILYGKPFDGMTTRMVKNFVVNQLTIAEPPTAESHSPGPVASSEKLTLTGTVEYKDIEGGYYAIDGYALVGDTKLIASLAGQRVVVRGTRDDGPSILMVDRIAVESISREITAARKLPSQVKAGGKAIKFDQAPVVIDGALMVPLRYVVEAAGGWVEWDAKERAVHVEMPDRQAWFWVGEPKAEMNENNVRYFARNMIAMAKAPVIQNGRVLVSADALTQILGLVEAISADGDMDLSPLK